MESNFTENSEAILRKKKTNSAKKVTAKTSHIQNSSLLTKRKINLLKNVGKKNWSLYYQHEEKSKSVYRIIVGKNGLCAINMKKKSKSTYRRILVKKLVPISSI